MRRRAVVSVLVFLLAAAVVLDGLAAALRASERLSASIASQREDKRLFYVARNVEETFWQTIARSAEACVGCGKEEAQALVSANIGRWKQFWENEAGVEFVGGSLDPSTRFPSAAGATEGEVVISLLETPDGGTPDGAGRVFSASVRGAGIFGLVGNGSTVAIIREGEERVCVLLGPAPRCDWQDWQI